MIPRALVEAAPRAPLLEGGPVRVLHAGRRPADVERARHHLQGHGVRFAVDGASTAEEVQRRLGNDRFDVLLLDEGTTDAAPLDVLRRVRDRHPGLTVVLLLRERDERLACEAMALGVYDYLVKRAGDLTKLPLVLENAAVHSRLHRERGELAIIGRFLASSSGRADVGQVLSQVVRTARELLGTDRNLVLLVESGDTLVASAWSGFPDPPSELRVPAEAGVWRQVLASPTPQRLDPLALQGPWAVPPGLAGAEAVCAMRLHANGHPLGILLSASTDGCRFSKTDEALMRSLADHAAMAVENARLVEQLVHAERLATVGRMVAGVAHELNNPLAVIMGTLELLGHETLEERLADRLGRVAAEARRAVKIVRTLLALARKQPAQRSAVAVNELLAATLELMAYDPRHMTIRIVRRFRDDVPAVLGDADQLQQVFTNLLLNASQAMHEAHGAGTLTVSTDIDAVTDRVLVTVADTGPGIKPEYLSQVFEPFFTTKGDSEGTGLGLAICRRIVEQHFGRIIAESRPGAGARFTVALPAAREAPRPEPSPRVEAGGPAASLSVLLVEDDELVGDMLEDILTLDGHRVDRASNGREALAQLRGSRYAVIVSDVKMPDLNGTALYHALMQLDPALARRVIFVTGDVMSADTRTFLDETGALYLAKPFAVADFKAVLRRALTR
jgi:signal transduction histidine kinase/DNA-binding response OmpR family regulator